MRIEARGSFRRAAAAILLSALAAGCASTTTATLRTLPDQPLSEDYAKGGFRLSDGQGRLVLAVAARKHEGRVALCAAAFHEKLNHYDSNVVKEGLNAFRIRLGGDLIWSDAAFARRYGDKDTSGPYLARCIDTGAPWKPAYDGEKAEPRFVGLRYRA